MAEFGEIEKAIELTDEAYRLCRGVGDVSLTALWLSNLAGYALQRGNTAEARRRLDESLALARLIDDTRGIGQALDNLGWIELLEGDLEDAFSCFEEAEAIARRLGARWLGADAIRGFAHVAAAGDADRAARLAGAALAFGGSAGYDPAARDSVPPHLDAARAALGEQAWQKARDEGARSTSTPGPGSRSTVRRDGAGGGSVPAMNPYRDFACVLGPIARCGCKRSASIELPQGCHRVPPKCTVAAENWLEACISAEYGGTRVHIRGGS